MRQGFPETVMTLGERASEDSALALVMTDGDGDVLRANPAGRALAVVLRELAPDDGFRALVRRVVAERTIGHGRIEVPGVEARDTTTYDLTLLARGDEGVMIIGRDASLDDALRDALTESRQRYKDLVEISSDFAWEVDGRGVFVFVSPRGALGYVASDLVGREPATFLLHGREDAKRSPFLTEKRVEEVEVWMCRADDSTACLLASAMPLTDAEGRWVGARGVCRDVTEDRERESALARARNRERILTYIVRTFRDEMDPANMLAVAAEAIAKGLSADGCQILHAEDFIDDADDPRHKDEAFRRPSTFADAAAFGAVGDSDERHAARGSLIGGADHVELTLGDFQILGATTRFRRRVNGAVILWRDRARESWSDDDRILIDDIANQIAIAAEQVAAHMNIVRISRTDPLTGLFNRRAFFGEVDRHFNRLRHDRKPAALMYIDLDNFKAVNDAFGHKRGDEVLLVVRAVLTEHTRPTDLVARLGGDEFAIWLDGADDRVVTDKAKALLDGARRALAPFSASEAKPLMLSIGVAVFDPKRPEARDALIQRADEAMYRVKTSGKGAFAIAPPAEPRTRGAS